MNEEDISDFVRDSMSREQGFILELRMNGEPLIEFHYRGRPQDNVDLSRILQFGRWPEHMSLYFHAPVAE